MLAPMGQKLVFMALAAVMTSVASALAYRAAVSLWTAATGAPPPESRLARLIVHRPLRRRILRTLAAHLA